MKVHKQTVKAKYHVGTGVLQNDSVKQFLKIYTKSFSFPPFFSNTFKRDTFKNNSWIQNSKSKNALPQRVQSRSNDWQNKTFPSVGLLSTFNLPGRKLALSCSKMEIINESGASSIQILLFCVTFIIASSFYDQTTCVFEVIVHSLCYKHTL